MTRDEYLKSARKTGLSAKAASVYVVALEAGEALSPKALVSKTKLHRQYVYDALYELEDAGLLVRVGEGRRVKYQATSPDRLLQEAEKKKIETLGGVQALMKLYDRSPAGIVEVIRGSQACVESEFSMIEAAEIGDFLDIVGGGGMNFVKLFHGRIEEWESLRKKKKVKLRYIGTGEDVVHNKTESVIENESRTIPGIGDIVNVCIRPDSVSFNIYEPEIVTVRVRSKEAVVSQRALFEVLWGIAK
jgi:Sugar-specific transcriptional regulator TrmB